MEELQREAAVRAMAVDPLKSREEQAVEALNQTVSATFDGLFSRDVM